MIEMAKTAEQAYVHAMTNPAIPPEHLSDEDLVDDYEQTDGEPGDPRADAGAAEIERRNLDL